MENKKEVILNALNNDIEEVSTSNDIVNLKVKYLGKKGLVTELTSNMKDLSVEEKKEVGRIANEVRTIVTEKISSKEEEIKTKE